MTKERRTITLARELDEAIAYLASAKQMSLSEFLETRLYMNKEIQEHIEQFKNLPDDPIIDAKKIEGRISKKIPSKTPHKSSSQQNEKKLLVQ
ncbi:MAG: hypothetical protein ACT4NT_03600 [Nitrososphaerota archaeon]